nr:hypothetical protein BaRGS_017270 [Batillaria attramentaria]
MLAPEAQRALIGWEPVNSRIITAKFITKKKDIKLNIIQCYAPTNDAEEEKKDDLYQQLQTVIDRGGAKDMTILMGDFNAKIGSDNTGYENTMGTHGLGQKNENGERFADFCALNQLVIGGSIFPHKRIHKATRRSPDHVTENQIDHICISRKFRRSWRDVRVMRGADKLEARKKKKTALNTSRTRRAKAKAQEEYTAADREVKRSTRKDKRDYIDNLANQAEEAAGQGNLKDLYQVTKKLAGKFQQTDKPVKDKNGHPLTTTEEQLKRWAEHFRELLNRPIPETPPDIPPAETELPINCDKPSKAEIRKAIMTLRNGKAAGPDEIPAEAIKADTETAVNMLHSLFSKIWEKEEVPAQWKEGIVIKLPKKGDLRDCSNYRGIMLLSVPGKSLEWNSPLYINFIDYEKAFDSVDREALWKLLRHYGVPGKIISLIQCTYKDMSFRIAHAGQLSESFEVKTGVRQGCLLSPFLFLLVIDWIMKTTTTGRKNGIQWTLWTQLDDLDFADDLALLSHSHSQMQDKTTCLEATSAGTGLKINRRKTELMKINTTANTPVTVGGEPIREVESFVYLGSVVDGQGGTDRNVTARIGKARAAMVMLKNIWASKVVSIRTKLRIFNSSVKSVLLYGCETWRTTKTMQQKIQTFLNTCLRRIFNIRRPEKIRNEELWERAGQEPAAKQILRRKWGWIGHTLRRPASSTTRQALTWNPQGKRKRGRPRNSWRRDTEAELYKQGTNWTGVARIAQNRDPLQKFVQLTKKYGKVFGYFEGLTPSVVVSDPVLIEQILVKHFNSFDGRPNSFPLLHGPETLWLQNINGAVWKQQRDALAPVFKATSIAKILPRIQTTADSYVKNLERARKEHPHGFDIRDINQQYSLDSFTSTVFDMDLDFLSPEDKTLFLQYMLAAHYSASPENPLCGLSRVYPSLAPVFRLLDRPHKRLTEQFSRRLSDFISIETPKVSKSRDISGLLHHLLSAHVTHRDLAKNNNSVYVPLTEDEVKGQMMGLVGGGVGTALSALHYCTHCLALHQDVQRKVREEVDEVCGGDFSQDISLDDVYRMEYLDMFINETLRHYPVAPGVARTCAEDCVVGGFQFRKGTVLRLLGSTQYMDPEIFPEPETFRPERFSKEEREKRHAYSWFPFGSGPRMCVARRLGLLQVKMALVRLVQHFETKVVHVRLVMRDKSD